MRPGEKRGEQGKKYKELGTKAVQDCAQSLEGKLERNNFVFPWEQLFGMILSHEG